MIPVPPNEDERIATLRSYAVLDTPKEESFDALTRPAAPHSGSAIARVDKNFQWFKSSHGLDAEQTPRDQAFCTYAIMENEPLVVLDATLDERFSDNPLVTGAPGIRLYAGAPLISPENFRLGTFCIIDMKPRENFHGFEGNHLIDFASTTVDILEMRKRVIADAAKRAAAA